MTDNTNPLAALLDGVPRYDPDWTKEPFDRSEMVASTDGDWLRRDDVLAALTLPYDEAGKVLAEFAMSERIWTAAVNHHEAPTFSRGDCRIWAERFAKAQSLITRLLAQHAADAARIRAFEAHIEGTAKDTHKLLTALLAQNAALRAERDDWQEAAARAEQEERIRTRQLADTTTRAEAAEAKVEKLRESLQTVLFTAHADDHVGWYNALEEARAALSLPDMDEAVEVLRRISQHTHIDAFGRERPSYEAQIARAFIAKLENTLPDTPNPMELCRRIDAAITEETHE